MKVIGIRELNLAVYLTQILRGNSSSDGEKRKRKDRKVARVERRELGESKMPFLVQILLLIYDLGGKKSEFKVSNSSVHLPARICLPAKEMICWPG